MFIAWLAKLCLWSYQGFTFVGNDAKSLMQVAIFSLHTTAVIALQVRVTVEISLFIFEPLKVETSRWDVCAIKRILVFSWRRSIRS